ncbi:MAG: glycosyltransferase family 4 protein [Opitutales bacterium]
MLAIITSHPIQYQAPLWRALAADGTIPFEVWFLTPHAQQPSYDREFGHTFAWDLDLLEGYPHRFLDIRPGWRLDRFNGIHLQRSWAEEFRTRGVTAVWLEGWRFRTLWQAVAAARRAGLRVCLRGESHGLAPEPALRRLVKRAALGWFFARVDHFLCIGTANRRFYLDQGIAPDRLSEAPYAVDEARFARAASLLRPQRAELRRRWGIRDDAWCVLFCGKLIPKKRPLDLVRASRLRPDLSGRPLHLLFAGDGELAAEIKRELVRPGTPPGTVTGFLNQSEIPAAFVAADCLALPSDYGETWGLVVNESLATGLPAVASDRCGCAEDLVRTQDPAQVYAGGDPAALATALAHVVVHPPSSERLRTLSASHVPECTVATVTNLLRDAVPPVPHV